MKDLSVAIIPARGGSKGIKNKNLKKINNKSLVDLAILCAKRSGIFKKIILSSDSKKILLKSKKYKINTHIRNSKLSGDNSHIADTIRDVVNKFDLSKYRFIFVIEPTSPLRNIGDLKKALKILNNGYHSICSFTEASTNPLRAWKLYKNKMIPFIKSKLNYAPRQHLINSYQPIGNVVAFRINKFPKKGKNIFSNKFGYFIVEKKRSIDIDNPFDLFLVRKILNH